MSASIEVVKVGSTSVTSGDGRPDESLIASLSEQVAAMRERGSDVIVVSSGAIATGLAELGIVERPREMATLQAASAVGQHRVVRSWQDGLGRHGILAGQVLLDPSDFFSRRQYLLARRTFEALVDLGVVPIVNENDAVADEEIRFGDNDRLAALVAVLVGARRLVMLTDTPGLLTADPSLTEDATLIEEVTEIDHALEAVAGGSASAIGSGGMTSKLAAARLATWSGIEAVIADARGEQILLRVADDEPGCATVFRARPKPLAARKAWIAFATTSTGTLFVDQGARRALESGASLLFAGVTGHDGAFTAGDAVEVVADGALVAKGLVRSAPPGTPGADEHEPTGRDAVAIHRDDLVVLV